MPSGLVKIVNPVMEKGARSAVGSVSVADDDRAAIVEPEGNIMHDRIEDASTAHITGSSGVDYLV